MSIPVHSRTAVTQDAAAWSLRDCHAVCIFAGGGGTCRVADAPDISEHALVRMIRQSNPDCSANVADEETCVYAGIDLAQLESDSGTDSSDDASDDDRTAVVSVPAYPMPLRISASPARTRHNLRDLTHNLLTWLLSSGVPAETARNVLGVYYPESQTLLCSGSGACLFREPEQGTNDGDGDGDSEGEGGSAPNAQWGTEEQDAIMQQAAEFRSEADGELVFTIDAPSPIVLDIANDLELRHSGEIAPRATDAA